MPQGVRTNPLLAAQIMNLGDAGYQARQISRMLDIPDRTALDIINRCRSWGEIAEKPVFAKLRAEQKTHLEAASRAIAAKCLIQVEEKLEKTSAYQAAGIYGLLRTHERLDAGEATANIEVINRHELLNEEEVLRRLASTLMQAPCKAEEKS